MTESQYEIFNRIAEQCDSMKKQAAECCHAEFTPAQKEFDATVMMNYHLQQAKAIAQWLAGPEPMTATVRERQDRDAG